MNVIDASIIASYLVRDQLYNYAEELLTSLDQVIVPELIGLEVANVIWKHIYLFKRISPKDGANLISALDELLNTFEIVPNKVLIHGSFEISLELGIPVYDSLYIYLSVSRDAKLYTFDEKLKKILSDSRYSWILVTQ